MEKDRFIKILKVNNTTAKVYTNVPDLMESLVNRFSIYIDKYWFHPKVKIGLWDGKINFVNRNGTFPIGLLKYVYNYVKRDDIKPLVDRTLIRKHDISDFNEITESWLDDQWVPRKHQLIGAKKALETRRCILEHATSSGKSLTMALITMYCLKKNEVDKILILVPKLSLIEQLKSDFIDYGVPEEYIGKFSGKIKEVDQTIIISTWQSMHKQKRLCQQFNMIICDEVHSLKGNVVRSVAESAINAKIRIGCTGTMPDHTVDVYRVEGTLGPVIHRVTSRELIDKGHAADIKIKILYLNYPKETTKELNKLPYDVEKQYVEEHESRNKVINFVCDKHMEKDHNMLILVNKINHAKVIHENLNCLDSANNVFVVTGEMNAEERERIRKFTNENKRVIIVATSGVFSTGISIKRLHGIIFASAGKSKIRTLQSVGRGLRMHDEKKKLMLYDIGDSLKYSDRHLEKRLEFYANAEFEVDVKEIDL